MENASKALVMAAGVLIAIIIIALLYSFINTVSENVRQEDERELAKQTEAFNKEYEAFEKKLMRGTDLITVINKALANNKKYSNQDKIYDVNVLFTLKEPVTQVKVKISNGKGKPSKTEEVLGEATSYSIIDDYSVITEFMQLGTSQASDSYRIVANDESTPIDDRNYTKVYDVFTVFKRKFFKCTKISYSDQTGRVNELVFEEIIPSGGSLQGYN